MTNFSMKNHSSSEKGFKASVVNRTCHSKYGVFPEVMCLQILDFHFKFISEKPGCIISAYYTSSDRWQHFFSFLFGFW